MLNNNLIYQWLATHNKQYDKDAGRSIERRAKSCVFAPNALSKSGSLVRRTGKAGRSEKLRMSFQAYLDNIQAKTGKSPDDFRKLAAKQGFTEGDTLKAGVKAGIVVEWLKADYALGHGHAMAIVALLKGKQGAGQQGAKLHSTRTEVPSVKRI